MDEKFVVAYSGNMGRAHEFDTILRAAEILKEDPNIIFLFIGGGKQKELIEAEAKAQGLKNILFKPYQPQEALGMSLTAADAHLVCLKPELEGLIVPSKLYGVLAAGRVVVNIGDPLGEVGRWVSRINCGLTVEPGEAAQLAEALIAFSKTPQSTREMGLRGRAYFDQHFDRTRSLEVWHSLLIGTTK